MREPIKVEKVKTLEDATEMAEWIGKLSSRNNVDPDIFKYPATTILKASNGEPVMYMPRQQVTMLEALAINPEAQASDIALALRALIQVTEYEARQAGQGELYFLCSDPETKRYALAHGMRAVTPATAETDLQLFERKL